MGVKIINVLKEDSFNGILDLFREASASEVILVLPRVGRLFRTEDHFAAFASEAQQAGKTVSVLTGNATTAQLARKFGFGVMAANPKKSPKTAKPSAVLTTAPPPGDYTIPSHDDSADLGDVPLTSDEQSAEPLDEEEADPLRGMHVEDEAGEPVDEDGDGSPDEPSPGDLTIGVDAGFTASTPDAPVATLAASPKPKPARPPQPNDIDGVGFTPPARSVTPVAPAESDTDVPIARTVTPEDVEKADLDYIDAVWRDKNGTNTPESVIPPTAPSLLDRTVSRGARFAAGGSMPKRIAAAIVIGAVIVLAGVIYLMTGSAYVALTPVGKTVDTQITVQASDTFTSVDDAFAKIPGQLIEVSKTAQSTATATGTRDVASKARGTITVYNEYSSTPQTLVATTRFQADNGKVFRTLQTITVPGSTVNAGQTVPGTVSVDVIADQPGTEYNIPAGRFTIMAFRERGETDKVEKFYGKSDGPMSGGASGPSAVVTQVDYDKAKEAALSEVRAQVSSALETQGAGLIVLDADKPAIDAVTSTANPDDAASDVTVTAKGSITTIAFRNQDLMDLIAGTILKKDRLTVLPDRLELSYSDLQFKDDLGMLTFTVSVKGTGYLPVDTDAIRTDIAGRNAEGVRDYFRDREGVQSATVTLSPFWVRRVPQNPEKIRIELLYTPVQP